MRAAVGPAAPAPSGPTMCRMTEQCRGACLSAWERRSEWPLTAIALAFLAVYAWEVIADLHGAERAGTELAMNAMWAVFIVDYLVRLALAPQRGRWFVRHLFDLAVVALPVLRPLRLVRLIALIGVLHRGAGTALRGRITAYTAGGVTLLVVVSSLAVLDAERGAPGTPIRTYGEAVWWALATITTVGYGDLAPVTAVGRWAAVLLMIGGVALAGVVTATLASWIVSLVAEESAEQEAATRAQVEVLQRQVTALIERVEHLGVDRSTRAAAPEPGSEAGAGVRAGAESESGPDAEPGAGARPVRPVGLFVGLAVLDVIQLVDAPPGPDEKIVALDQTVAAGGPAANAAVAFAALGGRALLAAPVGAGPLAELIRADLTAHGVELIDCAAAPTARGAAAAGPSVSSCTISAATGERSVVSTNARAAVDTAPLDRYAARAACGQEAPPDVVLIDGHNPALARAALDLAARAGALTVMDAGSWKDAAARLPGRCDVVAASARFYPPGPTGSVTAPRDVAHWLLDAGARGVVITRGARPALWWCAGGHDSIAPPQVAAVDTLGAGDVFHGALAHALAGTRRDDLTGPALGAAVERACDVAAASTEVFGTRAWRQRLD